MRILSIFAAVFLLAQVRSFAGQLDLAVIAFPEDKTVEELNAAFANVDLAEITDADRTRTKESYLKGGTIIFAQSLAATPGHSFGTSVRIDNKKAEVSGQLGSGRVQTTIVISEGIKAGLRSLQRKTYQGAGSIGSTGQVLSMRISRGQFPDVGKGGLVTMKYYQATLVVVAAYRP